MDVYPWLRKKARLVRKPLTRTVACALIIGLCIIAQAYIIAKLIDQTYLHHASLHTLHALFYFLGLTIALRTMLSFYREKQAFQAATTIKSNLRNKIFQQWITPDNAFTTQEKTGERVSLLIEQIEGLHGFYADYLPQMMITVILPFIILIIVFLQNWLCGLILLITAPLIPLFMAFIGMHTATLKKENFQLLAKLSTDFLNILQGLTTLSLFNKARAQKNRIQSQADDFRKKTMQILKIAFLSSAALELFATISIAIIAVYLGLGLLNAIHIGFSGVTISLQKALFILLLAPEFFAPLRQLGHFYHARAEALAAAEIILPQLKNTVEAKNLIKNNIGHPSLSIHHLSFSYGNNTIFQDFSLEIPFGSCLCLTGESGAGKSTLLHLLAKLLTPQQAVITANTIDLNKIDDDIWHDHITLLHQYPRLQTGTIFDNIAFANKKASRDAVFYAATLAGVTEFSSDLSAMIYEQNQGLSGGQIQRIALARIILKDTPIILFDEPTNYLDKNNIALFWELIAQWKDKKTLVIATHDPLVIQKMGSATPNVTLSTVRK